MNITLTVQLADGKQYQGVPARLLAVNVAEKTGTIEFSDRLIELPIDEVNMKRWLVEAREDTGMFDGQDEVG